MFISLVSNEQSDEKILNIEVNELYISVPNLFKIDSWKVLIDL